MKTLITILLSLFCVVSTKAITTTKVADAATQFGGTIAVNSQVYNRAECKLYVCTTEATSTETLNSAAEKFMLITNFNRIKDTYNDLFQGFAWSSADNTYNRMGSIKSEALNTSPGNAKLPVHALMKRCLLLDNGVVNYYLDPANSALKADGVTASVLDGTDGQVMVEIPKFYYRAEYGSDYRYWCISLFKLPGFVIHPAFIKNGVEVDFRYYSAFEGSMYDASAVAMTSQANITADIYATGDKLCSVAETWPKVNEQRGEFRLMAAQRGTGWRQLDFHLNSALQLLYIVEYASFNTQSCISEGRTLIGGTWIPESLIGKTGKSISLGNTSGGVGGNTNNAYMSYRGVENWFGNVWKYIDGITWDGRWIGMPAPQPIYTTNNSTYFADYGRDNMEWLCDAPYIGGAEGSINDFADCFGFLPSKIGAGYISDYYWQSSTEAQGAWRVLLFGGGAGTGGRAGGFAFEAANAWSYAKVYIGGRLCY